MIFSDDKKTPTCMRSALHYNWARFQNLFLFSPTDAIQTYFGEEVGLYFAFITVYTIGRPNPTQIGSPSSKQPTHFQLLQCSRGLEFGVLFMVSLPYPWKKKRVTSKNYVIWNWSCVQSATVDVHFIQVRTVLESKYQPIRKWVLFEFLVKEKCSASVLLHVFDNNNTGKSSNMT